MSRKFTDTIGSFLAMAALAVIVPLQITLPRAASAPSLVGQTVEAAEAVSAPKKKPNLAELMNLFMSGAPAISIERTKGSEKPPVDTKPPVQQVFVIPSAPRRRREIPMPQTSGEPKDPPLRLDFDVKPRSVSDLTLAHSIKTGVFGRSDRIYSMKLFSGR